MHLSASLMPRLARPLAAAAVLGLTTGAVCAAGISAAGPAVVGRVAAGDQNPVQKADGYVVELRLPPAGVAAGAEAEIPLRISDTRQGDPAPGVPAARLRARITLPADASVSVAEPRAYSKGTVPGDYALACTFPRAGEYRLELRVTPPGVDAKEFTVTFPVNVTAAPAAGAAAAAESSYTLSFTMDPRSPGVGQGVKMTFALKDRATGRIVTDFDAASDTALQVVVVREDLGEFFQEQPEYDERTGEFVLPSFGFPNGGNWRVFVEAAPRGAGVVTFSEKVSVNGAQALRTPLMARGLPLVREGGYTLTLKPVRLNAETLVPLAFTLTDNQGRPVTDLQPWRGGLAHLFLIERDGKTYLHALPDTTDPSNGRTGTLSFPVRFPKQGTYKGWVRFQRLGQTVTMPFILRVTK
jgi:hypothetical protein